MDFWQVFSAFLRCHFQKRFIHRLLYGQCFIAGIVHEIERIGMNSEYGDIFIIFTEYIPSIH
ncbi:MAG: hypothetical protein ACD_78C00231G0001, partial [uncultured bacterium (gcode 4)]